MATYDRTPARTLRVLLAFDLPAFRGSLASLFAFSGAMEVVGSVSNGPEAIELAGEKQPDLVIIQVDSDLDQAKKTLAGLKAASQKSRILVVTNVEDPGYSRSLLDYGADSYVVKSDHFDALIADVRDAVRNPGLLKDGALEVTVEVIENPKDGFRGTISERQMEVLLLAARGLSNRQIAASLSLSEATVSRHLANIYGKMDVSSRSEASKVAMSEGWISLLDITG